MRISKLLIFSFTFLAIWACSTTKKKGEVGWLGKTYHNTTSHYNGYFNANEILKKVKLNSEHNYTENYFRQLPLDPMVSSIDKQTITPDMDKIMDKMAKVATLHEAGDWVDDCYVMMGKAQFYKQDYEAAQETFEYFAEAFNPMNPESRVYKSPSSKKGNAEARKKESERKRAELREKREEDRKIKEKAKKDTDKEKKEAKDKLKKEQENKKSEMKKAREEETERKEKAREELKKTQDEEKELIKKEQEQRAKLAEEQRKADSKDRKSDIEQRKKAAQQANELKRKELAEKKAKIREQLLKKDTIVHKVDEALADVQTKVDTTVSKIKEKVKDKIDKIKEAKDEYMAKVEEGRNKALAELADSLEREKEALAVEEEEQRNKSSKNREKFQPSNKIYKKVAYHEGLLMLARVYTARKMYSAAAYYLNKIDQDPNCPKNVLAKLSHARAELALNQNDSKVAIEQLQLLLDTKISKSEKARYYFLLAQLYQSNQQHDKADEAYAMADKKSHKYDLSFYAKLNRLLVQGTKSSGSYETPISSLEKMAKEDKNKDYLGSINMAQAEIYFAHNRDDLGNLALEQANQAAAGKLEKIEIDYRLMNNYLSKRDYVKAASKAESLMASIDPLDSRFSEIKSNHVSLREVAQYWGQVQKADTVIRLAKMSDEELRQYAEQQVKAIDAQGNINNENEEGLDATLHGGSKFFAYNPNIKALGEQDFVQIWGKIKLEDNWRRSSKQSSSSDDVAKDNDLEVLDDKEIFNAKVDHFISKIGRDDAAIRKAHKEREEGIFMTGMAVKANLSDPESSLKILEKFLEEYPKSNHREEALYYMHSCADALDNTALKNKYFYTLTNEYPESKFSKHLLNPNQEPESLSDNAMVAKIYHQAYDLYESHSYNEAKLAIRQLDKYKDNPLEAKTYFLNTLITGKIEGAGAYIEGLKNIVRQFPSTPEQIKASEMLRYLKGDQEAFQGVSATDEEIGSFEVDDDRLHYVLVMVYNCSLDQISDVKESINKFNLSKFAEKNLKTVNQYLSNTKNTQMVIIRRFENKPDAMSYFREVSNNNEFLDTGKYQYEILPINQLNYREVSKQGLIANYRKFFEINYLQDGK